MLSCPRLRQAEVISRPEIENAGNPQTFSRAFEGLCPAHTYHPSWVRVLQMEVISHERQERDGGKDRRARRTVRGAGTHVTHIRQKRGAVMGIPKGAKVWLPNRRDGNGRYFHRDPDGRRWYGTAREVRNAILMPWRRDMLANGLRFIRSYAERYGTSREELAEWAKSKRRDAIHAGAKDSGGASITIPADLLIWTEAAARANGQTVDEWVCAWLREGVNAELDEQPDGKLHFTRHELAALELIAAT